MAVQKKPEKYTARGQEFDTEEEAKAFDDLNDAHDEYLQARHKLKRHLAAQHKTADGYDFEPSGLSPGYFIRYNGMVGYPYIEEAYLWLREIDFCYDGTTPELQFRIRKNDKTEWLRLKIEEVYAKRSNAEAEVKRLKMELIKQLQSEVSRK